ncbi:MAG: EamA family transporter [Marinoscillum sp.]
MNKKLWLTYAVLTTLFWGVWGAFTGLPSENGFPETLTYSVWAITMLLPAIVSLRNVGWKVQHDKRSVIYGLTIGLLGAGGQMLLFYAVTLGPPYLIFPIISLSPVVTIMFSFAFLKERASRRGMIGILLAIVALPLFEYSQTGETSESGVVWFVLALLVLAAWGFQAFFMKLSQNTMTGESVFFYMTLSGLLLIPVALLMTDFDQEINWGWDGPYLTAGIQLLNSVGALSLVFAFRYGKAIVVSPMTNAGAPLITAVISMTVLGFIPGPTKIAGIICAVLAAILLAMEPEPPSDKN